MSHRKIKIKSTVIKEVKLPEIEPTSDNWSPSRGKSPAQYGVIKKKPWDYKCEAWIPVIDTLDTLPYVIELLRLQTIRPYIVLVDTGSTKENFEKLEEQFGNDEDIEIHRLRLKAVKHSSDYPAFAMDLAMSVCRTEHLFCTHSDVFLRKQNVIEELLLLCDDIRPAVGYQMSPRNHADWEKMVSHTCTMLHIPTMDKISASWSLRRLCNRKGLEFIANHPEMGNNWPDTEILINYMLWDNNYKGKLIGTEKNFIRTLDERIDHCRSLTAARLYSPSAAIERQDWVNDAISKAKERINKWSNKNILGSLKSRDEIPLLLNKLGLNGVGVEIGVAFGDYSKKLLDNSDLSRLISIDPWSKDYYGFEQSDPEIALSQTKEKLSEFNSRSQIVIDTGVNASIFVDDNSVDFVYIDSSHTYKDTITEIETWYPKLRNGGIISGHDYCNGEEVQKAVKEFAQNNNKFIYTTEDDKCASFKVNSWLIQK